MKKTDTMRRFAWAIVAMLGISLSACGGSGGGGSSASTTGDTTTHAPANAPAGTTGVTSASTPEPSAIPTANAALNTVPVLVSSTPFAVRNFPMVNVTICTPKTNATSNCSTIDNVLIDTGSFGLRLFASAVPAATLSTLPTQTGPSTGSRIAECTQFGSGYTWGTVRNADIGMSGEIAQDVPIQVISDPSLTQSAPTDCQQSAALSTPLSLGANGILGVGVNPRDCGVSCTSGDQSGFYYACDSSACTAVTQALNQQVANPVHFFAVDNNGIVLEMPQVAANGSASASGTLVFGIDTQSNNMLAGTGATVLTTDQYGNFNAAYNGATFAGSAFFDSGSTDLFFQDASIDLNSLRFYVPGSTLSRAVTITGQNNATTSINFTVANALALLTSDNYAFNNLAHYMAGTFDFGIPFFYGRHVYVGIAGTSSSGGGTGPYVAYVSN
ncbi:DUF3443 family protein [Paraburkholderia ginsengisoli]|nr:DUF3443 family protein [Paraburkholderia ginsengisoli]